LQRSAPANRREAHLTRYRRQRAYQASAAALARRGPLHERTMDIKDKLMGDVPEVVKELAIPTLAVERACASWPASLAPPSCVAYVRRRQALPSFWRRSDSGLTSTSGCP
jgi:hypothetical protein